jgi:hypothetical protein
MKTPARGGKKDKRVRAAFMHPALSLFFLLAFVFLSKKI